MVRQNQSFRHPILSSLVVIAIAIFPAIAQQPAAPPAAPDSTTSKPNDPAPAPTPSDDKSVGKTKLEKETGTVNDRIFEVLPNYGTVEKAGTLPPLRTGQKFRLATASI